MWRWYNGGHTFQWVDLPLVYVDGVWDGKIWLQVILNVPLTSFSPSISYEERYLNLLDCYRRLLANMVSHQDFNAEKRVKAASEMILLAWRLKV